VTTPKDLIAGGYLAVLALRGDVIAALILGFWLSPAATLFVLGVFVVGLIGVGLWVALRWVCRLGTLRLSARAAAREDARRRALGY
jgi:uncharacterized membrane protein